MPKLKPVIHHPKLADLETLTWARDGEAGSKLMLEIQTASSDIIMRAYDVDGEHIVWSVRVYFNESGAQCEAKRYECGKNSAEIMDNKDSARNKECIIDEKFDSFDSYEGLKASINQVLQETNNTVKFCYVREKVSKNFPKYAFKPNVANIGVMQKDKKNRKQIWNYKNQTVVLMDVSVSMIPSLMSIDGLLFNQDTNNKNMYHMQEVINSLFQAFREHKEDDEKDEGNDNEGDNMINSMDEFAFLTFGMSDPKSRHCNLLAFMEFILESCVTKQQCIDLLKKNGIKSDEECESYIKEKNINNHKYYYIYGYKPLIKLLEKNGLKYCEEFIPQGLDKDKAGSLFLHYCKKSREKLLNKFLEDEGLQVCKNKETYEQWTKVRKRADSVPLVGKSVSQSFVTKKSTKQCDRATKLLRSEVYDILINDNGDDGKSTNIWRTRRDVYGIIDQLSQHYPLKMQFKESKSNHNDDNKNDSNSDSDDKCFDIEAFMKDIKTYIFGYETPLCQSLNNTNNIFKITSCGNMRNGKNILLIVSDGSATDGDPRKISDYLKQNNSATVETLIFSCYIRSDTFSEEVDYDESKQFFYHKDKKWPDGAKTMFDIASEVRNSDLPISTLVKLGWRLPNEGRTRLFIQASHKQVIDDFIKIIEDIKYHNDAIVDYIGDYHLDKMIDNQIKDVKAPHQEGKTCYANAAAFGLMLAHGRIYRCRKNKQRDTIGDFDTIKKEIIKVYGTDGGKTKLVIENYVKKCKYLHWQSWRSEKRVRAIIALRRCLIGTCELYAQQWEKFIQFFKDNPTGIITEDDLKIDGTNGETDEKPEGHAVLLVRTEPDCLIFANSWGEKWGDNGFFRAKNKNVLKMQFYDITFDESQLDKQDIIDYQNYCLKKTKDLIENNIPQAGCLPYECPQCKEKTPSNQYQGTFIRAICPKCNHEFVPTGQALVKSLYNNQFYQP